MKEILQDLKKAHNQNVFIRKELLISDENGYPKDIIESVSKLLFNTELNINSNYLLRGNEKWKKSEFNEYLRSVEFITVHYTSNVHPNAGAEMHAGYFVNENQPTSIHYCTGNDGIYLCLDNDKRGAHAGDSAGPEFSWLDTNVEYDGCDLEKVKVTVSDDFYYVVNGKKTIIPLPKPYTYKDRLTNHVYKEQGLIQYEGKEECVRAEQFFNKQGFAFKVENNKYFMSTTWWCYTQHWFGKICNVGGNRNSIGIESAVNKGSDLWYTWQLTAKLVAKLMKDNNLDITRVQGHHFFTAKDCPQPMMANDLEIWDKFIDLVKTEYLFMTKYKDYTITMEPLNNNDLLLNTGRIKDTKENNVFNYKVKVINNQTKEKDEIEFLSKLVYL